MPTYEYLCSNCDYRFETKQSFKDDALTICPNCHNATLHRVPQAAGVVFKGSGWYVTDSKAKQTLATPGEKKTDGADAGSSNGEAAPAAASTETKATESASKPAESAPAASTPAPAASTAT